MCKLTKQDTKEDEALGATTNLNNDFTKKASK